MPGQVLALSQRTDHDVTAALGALHTGPSRIGDEPEARAPRSLGRYVIVAELGAGGMGRVFRAYDPSLEREVALELLPRMTADARARIVREAKAVAQLCHPNVLPIYDVASEGRRPFIVMELVRGQSMREWLDTGAHPWWEVLEVFVAAARGLAAAHAAGLVHRDFEPGNVLIGDDGRVRVMDFGLAHGCPSHSAELGASGSSESWSPQSDDSVSGMFPARFRVTESHDVLTSFGDDLTATGTVVGTPAYMAPEQHVGHPADPRTDQYGFCVALWEALYGRQPFEGKPHDDWYRIKSTTTPRVEPGRVVPRWLHAVVLRGLAPRPSQRYPSMLALLQALARGRRRRRSVSLSLMAAVALVGLGGALHQASSAATLCSGARDELAGIWDAAAAAEAEHAVRATGVAHAPDTWARVAPRLDDYAERWQDACEATHERHEQPEALMDARMRCLDEQRRSLRALVRTLADADPRVVERAAVAVDELPPIDACADPPPIDPALAFGVETAR